MKHILSLALMMVVAMSGLFAKDRVSPHVRATGNHISISYGQPSKKGRAIFGDLVPYGKVWRAGADEATEIAIDQFSVFGGKQLRGGTYTLFIIPEKDQWTIILNTELKQWGAFKYDEIKDHDVLQTTVPVTKLSKPVEKLTYTIENDGIKIEWDDASVMVPVKFNK